MDEVVPGLYVGTTADATDEHLLREQGVTAIVSLTHEALDAASDHTVVDVPLTDGPQHDREAFDQAVTETLVRLDAAEPVLVHCAAGSSRSPSVAATALALHAGLALDAAFTQVADRRDAVDPHEALVRQAARVYVGRRG